MSEKKKIEPNLARALLQEQFPEWSDLSFVLVPSAGTDHDLFRLGEDKLVRLPRADWTAKQVDKEQQWLPHIVPHLPLQAPIPIAKGKPTQDFPRSWSVYSWLEGENAILSPIFDLNQAAIALADLLLAMQQIDASSGPVAGAHNFGRGVPLRERDSMVRESIAELGERVDAAAVIKVWEASLEAPTWDKPPVWVHGDIHAGNLLTQDGKLSAVIDFGGLGVGDPAVDLIVAWNLLTQESREVFRSRLDVDDATWMRGQGWALSIALIALPYYYDSNPTIVANSRRVLDEILAEFAH